MRTGDACLLCGARGNYLVDGGGPESGLPSMLADRRVRKLRAAVCSLACPERLGGVLELMEAGACVAEYWLPEGLESLPGAACRFNGDWTGWQRLVLGSDAVPGVTPGVPLPPPCAQSGQAALRLHGSAMLIALALSCLDGDSGKAELSLALAAQAGTVAAGQPPCGGESSLRRFLGRALVALAVRAARRGGVVGGPTARSLCVAGCRQMTGSGLAGLALLCGRLLLDEAPGNSARAAIVRGLGLAAMAAALLSVQRARLRFFALSPQLQSGLVARHPIKCLNGVEADPLAGLPEQVGPELLRQQVRRLADPDNGLVFVYGDAGCGALFCGDTRLKFLGRGEAVRLDRPTVVAAPRQGSVTADRAYGAIVSDDSSRDVWVRGFLPASRKVAPGFKAQGVKVCLNNCRTLAMQEILLEFAGGRWNREAGDECVFG
ncbi:MAG: hypothetical protein KKD85_05215 [Proteobacteria bacterium]|nr:MULTISPECIES: hypothetical protein [Pseudodesulfovibrio]MBU4191713.1 hypothetical protein [Pseudomonadota bacterium]MBU4242976.1 hypothetical protein [Pseudomonadota bacterium]MBV1764310.1 hypothetical protein [Pseudodesulfovibrio sp.]